jgi:hypothetical protein
MFQKQVLYQGASLLVPLKSLTPVLPRCRRLARSEAERTEQMLFRNLFSRAAQDNNLFKANIAKDVSEPDRQQ